MSRSLGRVRRCVRCRMQIHLCVCPWARPVPTETRVVVALHPAENAKPSNTGHLAPLVLPHAALRVAGPHGELGPLEPDPDRRPVLLFPRPDAQVIGPALRDADLRPLTLVVPDAAWRQARRMVSRWPALQGLPAVRLPDHPAPSVALRKTERIGPGAVGTLEALARALGILECDLVERRIRALLDRAVRHGLYARGQAPADPALRARIAALRAAGVAVP